MRTIFYADGYGIDSPEGAAEGLSEFIILQHLLKEGIEVDGFRINLYEIRADEKRRRKLCKKRRDIFMIPRFGDDGSSVLVCANTKGMLQIGRLDIKDAKCISGSAALKILKKEQGKKAEGKKRKSVRTFFKK